jgi:hypothetical protein
VADGLYFSFRYAILITAEGEPIRRNERPGACRIAFPSPPNHRRSFLCRNGGVKSISYAYPAKEPL